MGASTSMASPVASFLAALADVPAGVNGYDFAASRARLLVQPPPSAAVQRTFLALGIIHAVIALTSASLLVLRIRRGQFWLVRREASAVGAYLLCVGPGVARLIVQTQCAQSRSHDERRILSPGAGPIVVAACFGKLGLGGGVASSDGIHLDRLAPARRAARRWSVPCRGSTDTPDVSTLGLRFIRRPNAQSRRWPIATIYSAVSVLVPCAFGSAIVATSVVLVVSYVRPAS